MFLAAVIAGCTNDEAPGMQQPSPINEATAPEENLGEAPEETIEEPTPEEIDKERSHKDKLCGIL